MPVASDAVWFSVLPDMSRFGPSLAKGAAADADQAGKQASTRFSGSFAKYLKIGAAIGGAMAVAAGGKFLKESIREASDLGESLNAVNVTFGKNAEGIKKLGKEAADAVGLSQSEFNGLAVQFSAFSKTIAGKGGDVVGTMKDLTTRGADFASVMNLDVNEAMGLFQSGLAGETEPLRKYGIDLSAAAVEAHALSTGIVSNKNELTESAKVQARYSLLMQSTAKTQGDFANTSDSLANVQRRLGANWDDMQATVGMKLLPILEKFSGWIVDTGLPALSGLGRFLAKNVGPPMRNLATWTSENEKPLKVVAGVITGVMVPALAAWGVAATINAAKNVAAWFASATAARTAATTTTLTTGQMVVRWAFLSVKSLFHAAKVAAAWLLSMGPIGLVIAAVVGLVAVIVKNWDKIKDVIAAGWNWVKGKTADFWDAMVAAFRRGADLIGNAWNRIQELAKKPVNFIIETVYNDGIRAGFNKVAEFLNMDARLPAMSPIGGAGRSQPTRTVPGVQAFGGAGGGLVKTIAGKAWDWVKDKFSGPVNALLGRVGSSPWAGMMAGVGRRLASGALDRLKALFGASEGDGAKGPTGPIGKAGVVLPRGSYRIGMPYLGYPEHYGADYPAATGTPVYAMAAGNVSRALTLGDSYGKHVYLEHPGGIQTRYAHLNSYNVAPGQSVMPGQMIGTVGSTGNSSGPHLHFEYRRGGAPVNPASLGLFDSGGWLQHGQAALNLSGRPEPVLTGRQWDSVEKLANSGDLLAEVRGLREDNAALRGDVRHLARDFQMAKRTA